ncbi:MAG: helix-turn-helix domain-containing protein [Methylococcales bacterium]|nr:helix-turn-helix domain-containing protein [Methylococcales bacterium]
MTRQQTSEPIAVSGTAPIPLAEHVRQALNQYFEHLNGHETSNLYALVMQQVEKPLLEVVLAQTGQNQTKAAKVLGVSRSTLRKKLDLYQL